MHVDYQVKQRLNVISPCVIHVIMDVNTYEVSILNVRITFFVGYVTSSLSISKSLAMSEINHVNE